MHGARGGAPTGKQNGNYRHGKRTKEAIQAVRYISLLSRLARKSWDVVGHRRRDVYMDQALTPLINEAEMLELYKTRSSQAFLDQRRHVEEAQKAKLAAR
jgi:hypothetical protein